MSLKIKELKWRLVLEEWEDDPEKINETHRATYIAKSELAEFIIKPSKIYYFTNVEFKYKPDMDVIAEDLQSPPLYELSVNWKLPVEAVKESNFALPASLEELKIIANDMNIRQYYREKF